MKKFENQSIIIITLLFTAAVSLFPKAWNVFPHKPHIDGGIDCEQCHKNIKESTATTMGGEIPSKKICGDCHDEKEGYAKTVTYVYRQAYKFNHKVHVVGQGLNCKDCHEALYKKNIVPQVEAVPKMEYCFQCHDNTTATQYCMLCHINPTKPDDHKVGWERLHGKKASADKKECMSCHTGKESCLRCHRGMKEVYRDHNPNYELSHKYESRISLRHCRACHSERQCRDCHKTSGVYYKNPPIRMRHPLGWTNISSSSFHGKKARINITACTTCHTKNECNYCHFWFKRD
jgi:c(7)-type cytochrome triheme protein